MKRSLILASMLLLAACKRDFEPIQFGKEACVDCKMTIVEPLYATEFVDEKGKAFKFDDLACMQHFAKEHSISMDKKMVFVAVGENSSYKFIDGKKALFLQHESFKSPMNGHYRAFATKEDAAPLVESTKATLKSWDNL